MTPNPNPSPEDEKLAEDAYSDGYEFFRNKWIGDHVEMNADLVRHFVPRALSPQTLPAPGEVELRKALRNLEAACDDLAANRSSETYRNMVDCDRATPYLLALDDARRDARAILNSSATVAAANDEGVAEQAAKFADGVAEGAQSLYDLAARDRDTVGTLIHGEAVRVAKHIASAIRLLSQGEGK